MTMQFERIRVTYHVTGSGNTRMNTKSPVVLLHGSVPLRGKEYQMFFIYSRASRRVLSISCQIG